MTMADLSIRPASVCRFDAVSLGEVMLRLDPGEGRIRTARSFRAWEGGGEYNVARGLRRAFGLRTAVVTALADNEIGRLVEDFILTGGLDTSLIKWVPYDGIGASVRNGLNFTERGFGVRGAVGVSDRGHSAASQLAPGDVDWDHLFGDLGVRWLHTGGIFAALSESAAETVIEAVTAAKRHGTGVSYDLHYRPSLWKAIGGRAKAQEVNREIARHIDVMIGNEEDFTASLGFEVEGVDDELSALETDKFAAMIATAAAAYPNFQVIRRMPERPGHRHHDAHRAFGQHQRLGRDRLVPVHRRRPGPPPPAAGDHGPGRWRRLVRVRTDLRPAGRRAAADRGAVRRRTRSAGDDHPGRHDHGDQGRSAQARRRRRRPRRPLNQRSRAPATRRGCPTPSSQ